MGTDSLFVGLRCKVGWHRWDDLPTSRWLDEPLPSENRLGSAMEYRPCRNCAAITDVTAFFSSRDDDLGVPNGLGPLAAKRFREIMAGPRTPLADPPIPFCPPESWKEL
jgi:hypothetical protein